MVNGHRVLRFRIYGFIINHSMTIIWNILNEKLTKNHLNLSFGCEWMNCVKTHFRYWEFCRGIGSSAQSSYIFSKRKDIHHQSLACGIRNKYVFNTCHQKNPCSSRHIYFTTHQIIHIPRPFVHLSIYFWFWSKKTARRLRVLGELIGLFIFDIDLNSMCCTIHVVCTRTLCYNFDYVIVKM